MERAILNLAVAAVSPIIGKLIEKLSASYLGGDVTLEEIKKLHTIILPQIQIAIKATEEIPIDILEPWLMDLKAAALEAEDVLDLFEYEVIEKKVIKNKAISGFTAKFKEIFSDMLPKTKLKKSLEKLKQSANEAKDLLPFISANRQTAPQQDAKSQQSINTVSRTSSPIFGRDEERYNLINMLINETGDKSTRSRTGIPVFAVLGIGGAGKTTMAQDIYNAEGVENHFEMRMWVDVSRNFNVHRVTRQIIESAGQGGPTCSAINSLDALQKMLEGILNLKKFLLVLDDIWCEDKGEWDKLLIPLNTVGNKGSRILITTRVERVALTLGVENKNLVTLKELKVEDCLSILKHYAFDDASKIIEDRALVVVGEEIASKLRNSPLAARLVGSLLRIKVDVDAWGMINRKQDMLAGTLNCVSLSFHFLPLHLQRCFAFCSLFPKGYCFDPDTIDDLVLIWIAEGFEVPENNGLTAVEKGREYFNELVSYSFFQSHPSKTSAYVIHDLLHDVAQTVSEGQCFRIEAGGRVDIPTTTVHLSIVGKLPTMPSLSVLVNLRTLMCIGSRIDSSSLDVCTKLRVLYSTSRMQELPGSIGQLKHLRYLRADTMFEIPDSLSTLYHLQFLNLPNLRIRYLNVPNLPIKSIKSLGKSISNLVNLQCLLPERIAHIMMRPEIVGKLTSLQTLGSYCVETSGEFGIGQLKNLDRLGGSLKIQGLENVKDKKEATEARLNQKKHLEELSLIWNPRIWAGWLSRDGRVDEEVLEGIEPHSNLKKLVIIGYRGAKTPSWMPHILPSLQSLRLIDCPNLTEGPRLLINCRNLIELKVRSCFDLIELEVVRYSPNLTELEVDSCPNLTEVGPLPRSLKRLNVSNCPELKQLSPFPDSLERLEVVRNCPNFPNLIELEVRNCPNLIELEVVRYSPNLTELEVRICPNLTEVGPLPRSLKRLNVRHCPELKQLSPFPDSLERLKIYNSSAFQDLFSIFISFNDEEEEEKQWRLHQQNCGLLQPFALDYLKIIDCSVLNGETFNLSLRKFDLLRRLELWELPKLTSLLLGPNLRKLRWIQIKNCENLQSLEGIGALPHLESLQMWHLPELSGIGNLLALQYLVIWKCPKLTTGVRAGRERAIGDRLPSLEKAVLIDEPRLLAMLSEQCLNSIIILGIIGNSRDRYFSTEEEHLFLQLTSIKELHFLNCEKLLFLPTNLKMLSSLQSLRIINCPKLKDNFREGGPLHYKISHIRNLSICD